MNIFQMNWRSFLSLKAYVLVIFVVLWNLGLLYDFIIEGRSIIADKSSTGLKISGFTCLAACVFAIAVAKSKNIQDILVAPKRNHNFNVKEFYFMAFIMGSFAISMLVFQSSWGV